MKKVFAIVLTLCMLALFTACGNGDASSTVAGSGASGEVSSVADSSAAGGQDGQTITIGVALNALDEVQAEWWGAMQDHAAELGVELISTNAEGSIDKQLSDIDSLIIKQVDAIIVRATDTEGIVAAFEACAAAGIPTVDAGFNSNYEDTCKIIASQYTMGQLQANYLIDYLTGNPDETLTLGYVWGKQGLPGTTNRYNGFWETIEASDVAGRVDMVAEKVTDWSVDTAINTAEDWIQAYPEINCIVTQSDDLAIGVANARGAAGLELSSCIILGVNGSKNGIAAIQEGIMAGSSYLDLKLDSSITLDYAVKAANGEDLKGVTINPTDINPEAQVFITIDNYENYL